MTARKPDDRSGWSFLGFLRSVLGDGPSFWRLFALVLLLMFGYALAKGDVIGLYDHLTRHATGWEKWGIPPGGAGAVFGARTYLVCKQKGKAQKELPGNGPAAKPGPEKPPH